MKLIKGKCNDDVEALSHIFKSEIYVMLYVFRPSKVAKDWLCTVKIPDLDLQYLGATIGTELLNYFLKNPFSCN